MATEKLVVELDARTQKLEKKLASTESKLSKLDSTSKESQASLAGVGKVASNVGSILVKTTTAAVALGAAISAIALKAASSRRELELFATQAKTTENDFQSLAYSTNQFGISAEQIADISKDIADKVGEFSIAGTGAFQDYADVMRLTKEEAIDVAKSFENMSSEQVIGEMVKGMEGAGASGNQMTFVLESMGNDLSRLLPLFADGSEKLSTMKKRFDEVNGSIQITGAQAEALKEVSGSFDLLTSSMGNAATAISATIAPVLNEFINDIIDIVPSATQTMIDFMNSFLDAENITSIAGVNKEIVSSNEEILRLQHKLEDSRLRGASYAREELAAEQLRLKELEAQLTVLEDQKAIQDAEKAEGGTIGGLTGNDSGTGDQLQAISDRFKSEEELLAEKLQRELDLVGENKELRLQLEREYIENVLAIEYEAADERLKLGEKELKAKEKADKSEAKSDTQLKKEKRRNEEAYLNSANVIANTMFENNKGVQKGMVAVNAASGIIRQFAEQSYPVAIANSLAIGLAAKTQLSAIDSAGKGGGSITTPSAAVAVAPNEQFQQDTASLQIAESSATSSQVFSINVPDGDEIGEAIANWLNKAQAEGRT